MNTAPITDSSPAQQVVIGNQCVSSNAMAKRVEQDIAFLNDRLLQLEAQSRPNQKILQTYRSMLESRHSVLRWLKYNKTQTQPVQQAS